MYLTCSIGFGAVDQGAIERAVDGGQVACGHTGDACCDVSGQAGRGVGGVVVLRSIADGGQCGGDFGVVVERCCDCGVVACNASNGRGQAASERYGGVVGVDGAVGKDHSVKSCRGAGGNNDRFIHAVDRACKGDGLVDCVQGFGVVGPIAAHVDQIHAAGQVGGVD